MSLFKYFRSGIYLEKTLRYNELYFSANHELNDPNDLVSFYEFEDNESLWFRLLQLPKISKFWEIRHFYCVEQVFVTALNAFFKGRRIPSGFFAFQQFFKEIDSDLDKFLTPFLSEGLSNVVNGCETIESRLSLFKLSLKELLARGVNMQFFSVSFSEDALNPMMWAHYADGFKGCAIIYKAEGDIIKLTDSLYSRNYFPVKVLNVSYDDGDRYIPLLSCADADDKYNIVQRRLLVKNEFWAYENEKRAFVVNEIKSLLLAQTIKENYKSDPRDKIFHHFPDEIIGVVFGPNFDVHKKDKLEYILRQNRFHSRAGDFYVFDTKLSPSGDILIFEGRQCIVTNPDGSFGLMSKVFRDESLEELTTAVGIKNHSDKENSR